MNSQGMPLPRATLGRLPVYLQYLRSIPDGSNNEHRNISAAAVARALGYGEVQVRKDLALVSGEGKPRVGYDIGELRSSLESCLGYNDRRKTVIVGAGKLGCALLDYDGFADFGFEITAAFDIKYQTAVESDSGKPIYPMSEFPMFCRSQGIKTGIITVPGGAAQSVCDLMTANGITAIWSFAPGMLTVPAGIALREENLALSLAHLGRNM